MAKSAADLAAKMNRYATTIPRVNNRALNSAALLVKDVAVDELAKVAPRKRLNVGRNGAKLDVAYSVKTGTSTTALVRATGPWQLIENDTKLHIIAARRLGARGAVARRTGEIALSGGGVTFGALRATTRTRRNGQVVQVAGKRALKIGGNLRAYAVHRGTKGRHPWRKAMDRATPKVPDQFRRGHHSALLDVFTGQ